MTADDVMQPAPPDGATVLPVSFGQELLWLIDHAAHGSSAYNVPRTRRLRGRLDRAALQRAFDDLVVRHEILRTTYAFRDEQPVQVIHPACSVALNVVDLSALVEPEREVEVQRLVRKLSATPFDLAREFPLRVTLVRFADDDHVLHIDTHHIASDGGSGEILMRDLDRLYGAHARHMTADLPPLPIQYADFAVWERERLAGERLDEMLGYWRRELAGAEFALEVPTDFPRPAVAVADATTDSILLESALLGAIEAFARSHDATLYVVVLAAYQILLHRYSGQDDILIGSPVAGRAQPETENLIGYFASMIVQRGRFSGDPTVAELVAQVREAWLSAYEHAEVPFESLAAELQPEQPLSHAPLFQAVFTSLNGDAPATARLGDLAVLPFGNPLATTKFDLTLFMAKREHGLSLMLRARSTLWTPETVGRFLTHLRRLLEAMIGAPSERISRLPMLTSGEQRALEAFNATSVASGEPATVTELFDLAAARVPMRTAVVADDGEITFDALRRRANQLAQRLRRSGVARGTRIGIMLDRSVETLVALIGILKAGAAYVPLSLDLPAARRDELLAQAGVAAVVTSAAHAASLPRGTPTVCVDRDRASIEAEPDEPPVPGATPEDAAYVLFTSGSTGVPKGVVVTHRNIVHYTRAISRVLGDVAPSEPGDGFAALDGLQLASVTTLAADLGNTVLFPALCAGGTLHLIATATSNDPTRFAAYLARHAIDVVKITPGHLRALIAGLDPGRVAAALPRRWLVTGGEPLAFDLAQLVLDQGRCRLLNHYGPTETTVGACALEITAQRLVAAQEAGARSVPIGRPLANTRCHVLGAHGAALPPGVPGELFIGGDGVSRGYLDRDDLTAERFIVHPAFGRLYRTGDRVRQLPDGALAFLERVDGQVKIRGHRVELGEIEAALLADARITQAAARTWDDATGAYVAAYVVRSAGGSNADGTSIADDALRAELRARLAERLPNYMLPRSIALLESVPLNANGKVDRRALPAPDAAPATDEQVAPRTPTETTIAAMWAEVLKLERVGVHDDFLALGGHSIIAIRLLGKLSRAFGVRVSLRTLFDAPTVAQLAELVDLEVQLAALDGMSDEEAAQLLATVRDDRLDVQ